jgi:hypothetical protein
MEQIQQTSRVTPASIQASQETDWERKLLAGFSFFVHIMYSQYYMSKKEIQEKCKKFQS